MADDDDDKKNTPNESNAPNESKTPNASTRPSRFRRLFDRLTVPWFRSDNDRYENRRVNMRVSDSLKDDASVDEDDRPRLKHSRVREEPARDACLHIPVRDVEDRAYNAHDNASRRHDALQHRNALQHHDPVQYHNTLQYQWDWDARRRLDEENVRMVRSNMAPNHFGGFNDQRRESFGNSIEQELKVTDRRARAVPVGQRPNLAAGNENYGTNSWANYEDEEDDDDDLFPKMVADRHFEYDQSGSRGTSSWQLEDPNDYGEEDDDDDQPRSPQWYDWRHTGSYDPPNLSNQQNDFANVFESINSNNISPPKCEPQTSNPHSAQLFPPAVEMLLMEQVSKQSLDGPLAMSNSVMQKPALPWVDIKWVEPNDKPDADGKFTCQCGTPTIYRVEENESKPSVVAYTCLLCIPPWRSLFTNFVAIQPSMPWVLQHYVNGFWRPMTDQDVANVRSNLETLWHERYFRMNPGQSEVILTFHGDMEYD